MDSLLPSPYTTLFREFLSSYRPGCAHFTEEKAESQQRGHIFFLITISFLKIYLFIYLFMAVLGFRFWARAFSSCGKRGPLFIAVRGPLTVAASLVAVHRL